MDIGPELVRADCHLGGLGADRFAQFWMRPLIVLPEVAGLSKPLAAEGTDYILNAHVHHGDVALEVTTV